MNVVFSQSADAILGPHKDFRDGLVQALDSLPGTCFIDGRVGRSPRDDCVVLLCQGRERITVPHDEFGDATTVKRIFKQWSSPAPE
ncbi:MAG TPA: hypothetical protein VMS17_30625 [Gemmataceae bacterium]|nr:hypothetical protein [Gemmataceae bacterium]